MIWLGDKIWHVMDNDRIVSEVEIPESAKRNTLFLQNTRLHPRPNIDLIKEESVEAMASRLEFLDK